MMRTGLNNGFEKINSYNIRIFLLLGLIALLFSIIILRLFNLQISSQNHYLAQAALQRGSDNVIPAVRGEIYFTSSASKQSVLAATNITKNLVFARKKVMSDQDLSKAVAKLGPILEIAPKDLAQRILEGNENYLPLKRQLTEEESVKIKDLKLTGIYLQPEYIRFYPQNNLGSQVLGFLGFKDDRRVGQYGVEGKFEKELAGSPGLASPPKNILNSEEDTLGQQVIPAVDGNDIYLTLDPAIQFQAQKSLAQSVTSHGAESGSVVVVNPKTGAVLAMANYPDFDPNIYSKVEDVRSYNNSILASDYEPGSVFKAVTMAAGLNEQKITPQTTYTDLGSIQVDDRTIKNSDPTPRGEQTMTQVLTESLNTGVIFVEQQIGHDKFKEYVERFGFGKPVAFDLGGEAKGDISNLNKKGSIFQATASYGQGITTTAIQMIQSYIPIANGGVMLKPYIVDKIVNTKGEVDQKGSVEVRKVMDTKTAATLSAMLVDVVENGHGKRAAVPGYYIAGKTGTAQVAYKDKAGYDPSKSIGTFIGYGPVENPAFLMLVRIDNPKDVKFAESTAAPVFGEVANFILNYLQIPPTRH